MIFRLPKVRVQLLDNREQGRHEVETTVTALDPLKGFEEEPRHPVLCPRGRGHRIFSSKGLSLCSIGSWTDTSADSDPDDRSRGNGLKQQKSVLSASNSSEKNCG